MKNLFLCLLTLLLFTVHASMAQGPALPSGIKQLVRQVNDQATNAAAEQIYIHTDRPAYNAGDTLWFKAYVFDRALWQSSVKSGVLYFELANDSDRVVKRAMLPIYWGLGLGNVPLDSETFAQGGYTLRAYTNWMRNFPEQVVFKQRFYISNAKGNDRIFDQRATIAQVGNKQNVKLSLHVGQMDRSAVMLRDMQLRVTDGRRTVVKSKVTTDLSGIIDVNFDVPEKVNLKALSLTLQDIDKTGEAPRIVMPILFDRAENMDIQFMPEGGKLVAGLPAVVGFKAINEYGAGVDVSGEIRDSKAQVVTTFRSNYKGIGALSFMPQAGEIYTARVKLPNGSFKTYPLPAVAASGLSLMVRNSYGSDTCSIALSATPDVVSSGKVFYLMGLSRGLVCYGAAIQANKLPMNIHISNKLFPSGVARFIVTDANYQPTNERLAYMDHADDLQIRVSTHKSSYLQRDSVSMELAVTDKDGAPVQGSFSLAVTDDTQVDTDSLKYNSMAMALRYTGVLKGDVETPGYYAHASSSPVKWQQLDQLLLTQGWVGYEWADALKAPATPQYQAEKEPLITGKVTNIFNKPVAGSGVTLFSKKPTMFTDTVTDQRGVFTFQHIPVSDTAIYFIQAKNKRGKSFNVGIDMEDRKPPVFASNTTRTIPWFMNIDSTAFVSKKKQMTLKAEQQRISRGTLLKAVEVKAKKVVRGSKNINGPGEADIIIDQETMERSGRMSLRELLERNVKGFALIYKKGYPFWVVSMTPLKLIIDGIDVDSTKPETISRYEYLKEYLDYYDAEEIKGIELMTSPGNQSKYDSAFLPPLAQPWQTVYIEITTRSGSGPFLKKAVGTYVYRPLPFMLPKQFYAPKYRRDPKPDMTDIRATVHWEPNIITNKDGKATVSFYTADDIGTYTIRIEGADMAGSVGSYTGKIKVKRGS
ncbi:hypothetical protein LLH06_16775 [Mucilaginibacter daejeonensis]|uniref:hypothetical protein n=1 Tax=Mucilaginibacter daejeonensis TaxID=398049 RepID=UPI001D1702F8|nr:hypothetical protein [Mucilaginibacter daejeonensis]UEG52607.1 hypothetical protein LLH06_16775 [Mucilaginibacter daejeonensis]